MVSPSSDLAELYHREVKEFGNGAHVTLPAGITGDEVIVINQGDHTTESVEQGVDTRISEWKVESDANDPLNPQLTEKIVADVDLEYGLDLFMSYLTEDRSKKGDHLEESWAIHPGLLVVDHLAFDDHDLLENLTDRDMISITPDGGSGIDFLSIPYDPSDSRYDIALNRLVEDIFVVLQAQSYRTDSRAAALRSALDEGFRSDIDYTLEYLYHSLTESDPAVSIELSDVDMAPIVARIQPLLMNDIARSALLDTTGDSIPSIIDRNGVVSVVIPSNRNTRNTITTAIKRRFLSTFAVDAIQYGESDTLDETLRLKDSHKCYILSN